MKSFKKKQLEKISMISNMIIQEENRATEVRNNLNIFYAQKQSIENKFLKIKLEILTIDFTLKEICKFI
jgi:hypothetical protein